LRILIKDLLTRILQAIEDLSRYRGFFKESRISQDIEDPSKNRESFKKSRILQEIEYPHQGSSWEDLRDFLHRNLMT
jgi:hypothetical protein